MATQTLTAEALEETLDAHDIVLLDFWAEWCGPCHQFAPIFADASDRHPDVLFAKVNVDEQQELAASFGVQSIPTVAAVRDGVVLFSQPGVLPGDALDEVVAGVQDLDMDTVHAELAARSDA